MSAPGKADTVVDLTCLKRTVICTRQGDEKLDSYQHFQRCCSTDVLGVSTVPLLLFCSPRATVYLCVCLPVSPGLGLSVCGSV